MLRRFRNILLFHPTLSTQNSRKRPELKGSQTVKSEVGAPYLRPYRNIEIRIHTHRVPGVGQPWPAHWDSVRFGLLAFGSEHDSVHGVCVYGEAHRVLG